MELFEEIRREYTHGVGTIQGTAQKLGVHRRMVRQALASAVPPERKQPVRRKPAGGTPFRQLNPTPAWVPDLSLRKVG